MVVTGYGTGRGPAARAAKRHAIVRIGVGKAWRDWR